MKRSVLAAVLAGATVSGGLIAAGPAEAATTGNVYVVVRDSACGKDKVRGILANVDRTGWTTTRWDNGDNIVYPKVRMRVRNQVSMEVRCEKKVAGFFWQTTGYRPVVARFTPTTARQTFWVG